MKKEFLALLVTLALCVLAQAQDSTSGDLEKMQGKWTPSMLYLDRQRFPDEALEIFVVAFKAKRMSCDVRGIVFARADFTLDPTKAPKRFEFVVPRGPDKGKILPGIYELDGDTLKIAVPGFNDARPKDYSVPENGKSDGFVMILRRAKDNK